MKDYDYAMIREAQERVAYIGTDAARAREVGIEPSTWNRWTNGEIRTPLRKPADALRRFLGIDKMPPDEARKFLDGLAGKWPRPATPPASASEARTQEVEEALSETERAVDDPKLGTGGGREP